MITALLANGISELHAHNPVRDCLKYIDDKIQSASYQGKFYTNIYYNVMPRMKADRDEVEETLKKMGYKLIDTGVVYRIEW